MKTITLLSLWLLAINSRAQFFINSGAKLRVSNGAIITILNMDAENRGKIFHGGRMAVRGSIINQGQWFCDSLTHSRINLSKSWTNNSLFKPGNGRVEFNGTNQVIGGASESYFFILKLNGIHGNSKTLQNNVVCIDSFYLQNVEMATNGNRFFMKNALIPVQRSTGYISTFNSGSVRIAFPEPFVGSREIPLGIGTTLNGYKPVFAINPSQDSFDLRLIGNSPSIDGRPYNSRHDSICNINNSYYYSIKTYGSDLAYGVTKNFSEQEYTKLAHWIGNQWAKISNSGESSIISTSNLTYQSQIAGSTEFISQAIERPFVDLGNDTGLMDGDKLQLKPRGYFPAGSSFLWENNLDLSCLDCPDPVFTMGKPGIQTFTVSNGLGCEAKSTLNIYQIGDYRNLIPNAFTPNGDKLNDFFGPVLFPGDQLVNLEIFNNRGEKFYEGAQNWEGVHDGKVAGDGVYFYRIIIRRPREQRQFEFSGNLTLIR